LAAVAVSRSVSEFENCPKEKSFGLIRSSAAIKIAKLARVFGTGTEDARFAAIQGLS
jgi:hypothetical protein